MLIYNKDTVLLKIDSLPKIDKLPNGHVAPCIVKEYGLNGRRLAIGKAKLKEIMRTNEMPKRYPNMKIDICNYTLTSDNRLVSAGERKFNEYREHPELLYDTELKSNLAGKNESNTEYANDADNIHRILCSNIRHIESSIESKAKELLAKTGSTVRVMCDDIKDYDAPKLDLNGKNILKYVAGSRHKEGDPIIFDLGVIGHPAGRFAFKFALDVMETRVDNQGIHVSLYPGPIHCISTFTGIFNSFNVIDNKVLNSLVFTEMAKDNGRGLYDGYINLLIPAGESDDFIIEDKTVIVKMLNVFNLILKYYNENIIDKIPGYTRDWNDSIFDYKGAFRQKSISNIIGLNIPNNLNFLREINSGSNYDPNYIGRYVHQLIKAYKDKSLSLEELREEYRNIPSGFINNFVGISKAKRSQLASQLETEQLNRDLIAKAFEEVKKFHEHADTMDYKIHDIEAVNRHAIYKEYLNTNNLEAFVNKVLAL